MERKIWRKIRKLRKLEQSCKVGLGFTGRTLRKVSGRIGIQNAELNNKRSSFYQFLVTSNYRFVPIMLKTMILRWWVYNV